MTDQEMLKEVIELGIERGWETLVTYDVKDEFVAWAKINPEKGKNWQSKIIYWQPKESILFNHEFAKAFWKEDPYHDYAIGHGTRTFDGEVEEYDWQIEEVIQTQNWQYHLQQCVISESPIKYYFENRGEK